MAKQLIGHDIGQYVFSPSTKQIVLVGVPDITLEQLLTIVNTTDGIMIYCFADSTLGGSENDNIITVNYDTTSMSATDNLQIYVDIPDNYSGIAAQVDSYQHMLLERICDLLEPIATQDSANRQRITIDSITGSLTLGTVSTITNAVPIGNVATLGNIDPRFIEIDIARNSYANCIRNNLVFTN